MDLAGDMRLYNPTLNLSDLDGVITGIIVIMLVCNRIALTNLALQQARGIFKLISQLKQCANVTSKDVATTGIDVNDGPNVHRIRKELLASGNALASFLFSKREYTKPMAEGTYSLDPRLLLFEFHQGVLLRRSQVQLVLKLVGEVKAGGSACCQVSNCT